MKRITKAKAMRAKAAAKAKERPEEIQPPVVEAAKDEPPLESEKIVNVTVEAARTLQPVRLKFYRNERTLLTEYIDIIPIEKKETLH